MLDELKNMVDMEQLMETSRPRARASLLAVAMLLAAAVFLLLPPQALAANDYGQICAEFESGTNPYDCDDTDPFGGNVFGAYQMDAGNAVAYAKQLQASSNKTYKGYGDALLNAYKKDGNKCTKNFAAAWKSVFKNDRAGYLASQYSYVKSAYYDPAVKNWQSSVSGFKASNYSTALKNAIFSTAVQHGTSGSASVFAKAMSNYGGFSSSFSEDKIIAGVYAERARIEPYKTLKARVSGTVYKISSSGTYVSTYGLANMSLVHFYSNPSGVQASVYNRLASSEPAKVFALYEKKTGKKSYYNANSVIQMTRNAALDASLCKHVHTTGGKVTKYSALTDKNHKERVSAVRCADCKAVVKAAYTRTVANKFVQKGANWKDVSGQVYTVHSKGWYKAKSALNIRAKTSVKAKLKTTAGKKAVVKVAKAVMGKDGFWWGKVKVNGKTGYVRMHNLAKLGTGGGVHKYVNGKCKYCGKTKTQVARVEKIAKAVKKKARTYTVGKAAKAYKTAYPKTEAKALAAGEKVRLVKVYRNLYYDYWGKTADGTWVDLTVLK